MQILQFYMQCFILILKCNHNLLLKFISLKHFPLKNLLCFEPYDWDNVTWPVLPDFWHKWIIFWETDIIGKKIWSTCSSVFLNDKCGSLLMNQTLPSCSYYWDWLWLAYMASIVLELPELVCLGIEFLILLDGWFAPSSFQSKK